MQGIIVSFESRIEKYNEYQELFKNPDISPEQIRKATFSMPRASPNVMNPSTTIDSMENNGDIKLRNTEIRNLLLEVEYRKNCVITSSQGNNLQKNNLLSDVSSYYIQDNLGELMFTQPELGTYFNMEENLPRIIITLNGVQAWKYFIESDTADSFKQIVKKIDNVMDLIRKEIEK